MPGMAKGRILARERPGALDLPTCSPRGLEAPERDWKPQAAWECPCHRAGAALQARVPMQGPGVGLTVCPPRGASGVDEAGGWTGWQLWDQKHRGPPGPSSALHREERPGADAEHQTAKFKAPLSLTQPCDLQQNETLRFCFRSVKWGEGSVPGRPLLCQGRGKCTAPGLVWARVGLCGSVWVHVGFRGFPWARVCSRGLMWVCMGLRAFVWVPARGSESEDVSPTDPAWF